MADNGCCGCDDDNGSGSGDSGCPKSPERMTNWRTEHTRLKLPEDNFAFPIGGERTDPYDCNCDPPTASCCLNMDDIPDTVYAHFYLDQSHPFYLLYPQAGRLGDFHFYTPKSVWAPAGNQPPKLIHYLTSQNHTPIDCFYPYISSDINVVNVNPGSPTRSVLSWDLKRILEKVGGSLDEDKRFQEKFTIELKRDRTFDSSQLPETISAVRVIHDFGQVLGPEAFHYRDYYSTNDSPKGVVLGRVPDTDYMSPEDAKYVQGYSYLQTKDCVPKMVWTGKGKTPGGREIQVLYFCDGVDSQGQNQFRTMIYHLDELPNLWGTFKERDFWNLFEKFTLGPVGWWSYTQDRDWNRFLYYSELYEQFYLSPADDYRVCQNPYFLFGSGYEWVDQSVWNYITAMSNTCYNLYAEYCSRRGYYYTPNMSVQLDGPFQATTVRQLPMMFEINNTGNYWPLDSEGNVQYINNDDGGSTHFVPVPWTAKVEWPSVWVTESEIDMPFPFMWNDYYDDAAVKFNIPSCYGIGILNSLNANQWMQYAYTKEWKFRKGPKLGDSLQGSYQFKSACTAVDYEGGYYDKFPVSWVNVDFRDIALKSFVPVRKRAQYPYGVLYPNKVPLLHKLYGNKHCPFTTPNAFSGFKSSGLESFPVYALDNGSLTTQTCSVNLLVYKPYYPPPLYKMDVRLHKDDLPVEQDAHRAKIYCPALPGNGIENVPDRFPPDFKFPDGVYPKYLFVSIDQDFKEADTHQCGRAFSSALDENGNWIYPAVNGNTLGMEMVKNFPMPSGTLYHAPKNTRKDYTDLFVRLDFVGLGEGDDPNNITLNYGQRWTPDGFVKSRYVYNVPSNILWKNTVNNFFDMSVTLTIKSSDPEYQNLIIVGNDQENLGLWGLLNSNHTYSNVSLTCPYLEVPMMRYYYNPGSNPLNVFPHISPILEFSEIDQNFRSPMINITSSTWGFKSIVSHHSTEWTQAIGQGYVKIGVNSPNRGTYATANITDVAANGVIGGPCKVRNGNFPSVTGNMRYHLDLYFCEDSDLQAIFQEGEAYWPTSMSPFGYLSPPGNYGYGAGTSIFSVNNFNHYESAGKYPYRKLLYDWNGDSCGPQIFNILSIGNGTNSTDPQNGTKLSINTANNSGTFREYDGFLKDNYETPYQKFNINGQELCLKAPSFQYIIYAYRTQNLHESIINDTLDIFVRNQTKYKPVCPYHEEGMAPPIYYHAQYTYSTGSFDLQDQLYTDCDLNTYTVQQKIVSPNSDVNVDRVQAIPGINIPRYIYPYGYFFKAIISA